MLRIQEPLFGKTKLACGPGMAKLTALHCRTGSSAISSISSCMYGTRIRRGAGRHLCTTPRYKFPPTTYAYSDSKIYLAGWLNWMIDANDGCRIAPACKRSIAGHTGSRCSPRGAATVLSTSGMDSRIAHFCNSSNRVCTALPSRFGTARQAVHIRINPCA